MGAELKPRALDLFCCAGGATKGLQRAGFHVTGVDIRPQPRYCGDEFVQGDALTFPLEGFDFIWASPPCQAYTALRKLHPGRVYPDLISQTRARLETAAIQYVIENVPGAPLRCSFMLCGSAFGLLVRRHRIFEASFLLPDWAPRCKHGSQRQPIDVSGTGSFQHSPRKKASGGLSRKPKGIDEARAAMGIDWMERAEISQAIPPAYSEFIGQQVMQVLRPPVVAFP